MLVICFMTDCSPWHWPKSWCPLAHKTAFSLLKCRCEDVFQCYLVMFICLSPTSYCCWGRGLAQGNDNSLVPVHFFYFFPSFGPSSTAHQQHYNVHNYLSGIQGRIDLLTLRVKTIWPCHSMVLSCTVSHSVSLVVFSSLAARHWQFFIQQLSRYPGMPEP